MGEDIEGGDQNSEIINDVYESLAIVRIKPIIVRIKDYPRSTLAKALNYCAIVRTVSSSDVIYSHNLSPSKSLVEILKYKDALKLTTTFVKSDKSIFKKGEALDKNTYDIFIVCQTNSQNILVPRDDIEIPKIEGD